MLHDKTVLTGVKPTGVPHIGNMVGAILPAIRLSSEAARSFLFIADLHALNSMQDRFAITENTYTVAATFIALGLNLDKTVFFRQSDIPEVAQLSNLLMNVTPKGLMNRAHAYKAVVAENESREKDADEGVNMGLFTYPVLMAADILLYGTDLVPVGQDQKQHVEYARDIAGYINGAYGREVLVMPTPVIGETANAVPGYDGRKMSKSYGNTIEIFAGSASLRKKIMAIVTDSKRPEEPKNPQESTIYQLYTHFGSDAEVSEMAQGFRSGGMGYGDAKAMLFAAMDRYLAQPEERFNELMSDTRQIDEILNGFVAPARAAAQETLARVSDAMLGRSLVKTD